MLKAKIIRPISRNTFAVQLDDLPCGPIEIQCSSIEAGDRRVFNENVKEIDKLYKEFLLKSNNELSLKSNDESSSLSPTKKKRKIETNEYSINHITNGIKVDLKLGNYCLSNKCWVCCTLYFDETSYSSSH